MTAGSKQTQRTIYFNTETDSDILAWLERQQTSTSDAVKSAVREKMHTEPEGIRRELEDIEKRKAHLLSVLPAAEARVVAPQHVKDKFMTKESILELLRLEQIPQGDRDQIFFWEVFRRVAKGDRTGLQTWANPGWKDVVKHVGFKNIEVFLDEVFAAYQQLLDDKELSEQIPDWYQNKGN